MFAEVICEVGIARLPVDIELTLLDTILYPMISHIDGFGVFLFYCLISDPRGSIIVSLNGGGGLFVPHVIQCLS